MANLGHEIFYLGLEWEGCWPTDRITFISTAVEKDISRAIKDAILKYKPDWLITCLGALEFPSILFSKLEVPKAFYLPVGDSIPPQIKLQLGDLGLIFAPTELCHQLIPKSEYVGIGATPTTREEKEGILMYKGPNNWTASLATVLEAVPEVKYEHPWTLELYTDIREKSNQELVASMLPMEHVEYSEFYDCQIGLPIPDGILVSEKMGVVWPVRTSPLPILLTECEANGVPFACPEHPTTAQFRSAWKVPQRSVIWGTWGREAVTSPSDWARAMEALLEGRVKQPRVKKPTWKEVAERILSCLE